MRCAEEQRFKILSSHGLNQGLEDLRIGVNDGVLERRDPWLKGRRPAAPGAEPVELTKLSARGLRVSAPKFGDDAP